MAIQYAWVNHPDPDFGREDGVDFERGCLESVAQTTLDSTIAEMDLERPGYGECGVHIALHALQEELNRRPRRRRRRAKRRYNMAFTASGHLMTPQNLRKRARQLVWRLKGHKTWSLARSMEAGLRHADSIAKLIRWNVQNPPLDNVERTRREHDLTEIMNRFLKWDLAQGLRYDTLCDDVLVLLEDLVQLDGALLAVQDLHYRRPVRVPRCPFAPGAGAWSVFKRRRSNDRRHGMIVDFENAKIVVIEDVPEESEEIMD